MIYQQYSGNLRFKFVLSKLPPFVARRLEANGEVKNESTKFYISRFKNRKNDFIQLTMLEYFFFHFADYCFEAKLVQNDEESEPKKDLNIFANFFGTGSSTKIHTMYLKLLQSYLDYFLDTKREVNAEVGLLMTQIFSDVWLHHVTMVDSHVQFSSKFKKNAKSPLHCFSLLQAKLFASEKQAVFAKPMERDYGQSLYSSDRHIIPLTTEIQLVQLACYRICYYGFNDWPKNEKFPFKLLEKIWMTQILPPHIKEDIVLDKKHESYILSNWVFYNDVFAAFLKFMDDRSIFFATNEYEIIKSSSILSLFLKLKDKLINLFKKRDDYHLVVNEHLKTVDKGSLSVVFDTDGAREAALNIIVFAIELCDNPDSFESYTSKQSFDSGKYPHEIEEKLRIMFGVRDGELEGRKKQQIRLHQLDEEVPEVDYDDHGVITPESRILLRKGLRRVNPNRIHYKGDELSKPRHTYEVPYLVNTMIYLSRKLNRYFETRAINLRFLATWFSLLIGFLMFGTFVFAFLFIKLFQL